MRNLQGQDPVRIGRHGAQFRPVPGGSGVGVRPHLPGAPDDTDGLNRLRRMRRPRSVPVGLPGRLHRHGSLQPAQAGADLPQRSHRPALAQQLPDLHRRKPGTGRRPRTRGVGRTRATPRHRLPPSRPPGAQTRPRHRRPDPLSSPHPTPGDDEARLTTKPPPCTPKPRHKATHKDRRVLRQALRDFRDDAAGRHDKARSSPAAGDLPIKGGLSGTAIRPEGRWATSPAVCGMPRRLSCR